jgi:hypothetical protein
MENNTPSRDRLGDPIDNELYARSLVRSSLNDSKWPLFGISDTTPISKVIDPDCPDRLAYQLMGRTEISGGSIPITFEIELPNKNTIHPLLAVYPDDLDEVIHFEIPKPDDADVSELQAENFNRIERLLNGSKG